MNCENTNRYEGLPARFPQSRIDRWVTIFLIIGVAARVIRYLLKFPLWEDEAYLCVNFIDASFAELLLPLRAHQVAPPLFLWGELAAVRLFGFSEWSLRLIPLLAGLAGLFLFRVLAGRLLSGFPLLIAVGIFAVAYPAVRHASEAKQYSTDLLAALLLLCAAVQWHRVHRRAWLWGMTAAAPVLLWLSYPAAFVAGGVSLAIAFDLLIHDPRFREFGGPLTYLKRREPRAVGDSSTEELPPPTCFADWLGWLAFNLAVLIGFATVYFVIRRQSSAELGFMTSYWADSFPPMTRPWWLPVWFVRIHTGTLLAWPIGGERGASAATALAAAVGILQLLRRRGGFWGWLLLGPALLNLVAAALHRYPYGGHFKFSMHMGPAICLLAGWGAAMVAKRGEELGFRRSQWLAPAMVAYLLVLTGASTLRDFVKPAKTLSDARAQAFASWFWFDAEAQGPVLLVDNYRGNPFCPDAESDPSLSSIFLCNRAIYSPAARGETVPADLTQFGLPDDGRQRFVVYRMTCYPFETAIRDRWLADLQTRYEILSKECFPFTRSTKSESMVWNTDFLDVYTVRPRGPSVRLTGGDRKSEWSPREIH